MITEETVVKIVANTKLGMTHIAEFPRLNSRITGSEGSKYDVMPPKVRSKTDEIEYSTIMMSL